MKYYHGCEAAALLEVGEGLERSRRMDLVCLVIIVLSISAIKHISLSV